MSAQIPPADVLHRQAYVRLERDLGRYRNALRKIAENDYTAHGTRTSSDALATCQIIAREALGVSFQDKRPE